MIVIVSNKQKSVLDNANIDAIKDLNGVFNVQDLINNFKNYFFTKMVIDATSIVDFTNPDVLKQLASGIGSEKLVVLLPPKPEPPLRFLETLVNIGIYNFSTNIDELINLISNPHDKDSINRKIHNLGPAPKNNAPANNNNNNNNQSSNVSLEQGLNNIENINAINPINPIGINNTNDNTSNNDANDNLNDYAEINAPVADEEPKEEQKTDMISLSDFVLSENSIGTNNNNNNNGNNTNTNNNDNNNSNNNDNNSNSNNIQNESSNNENLSQPDNNQPTINGMNGGQPINMVDNSSINQVSTINNGNSFLNNNQTESFINAFDQSKALVVGFRNITEHAGTTTLIYKLKETLENRDRKHIALVEVGTNDLSFFRLAETVSIQENELDSCLSNFSTRYDYVFVDLNQTGSDSLCNLVLYLVEPTKIKINKLIVQNRNIFNELKDKYVVLNKSMLSDNEIGIFSQEANMPFYATVGPFNDRTETNALDELINKLEEEKNNVVNNNSGVQGQNQSFLSF